MSRCYSALNSIYLKIHVQSIFCSGFESYWRFCNWWSGLYFFPRITSRSLTRKTLHKHCLTGESAEPRAWHIRRPRSYRTRLFRLILRKDNAPFPRLTIPAPSVVSSPEAPQENMSLHQTADYLLGLRSSYATYLQSTRGGSLTRLEFSKTTMLQHFTRSHRISRGSGHSRFGYSLRSACSLGVQPMQAISSLSLP